MTKEKEEVVEVSDSEDDFEVFSRSLSLEIVTGDPSHLPPMPTSHAQEDYSIPASHAYIYDVRQHVHTKMSRSSPKHQTC